MCGLNELAIEIFIGSKRRSISHLKTKGMVKGGKVLKGSVNLVISVVTVVGIGDSQVVSDPSDDVISSMTLAGPRRALIISGGGPDRTERTNSTPLPSLPREKRLIQLKSLAVVRIPRRTAKKTQENRPTGKKKWSTANISSAAAVCRHK